MALKNNLGKIGVLMGGPSSEREVSFKSGKAVYESLKASGIEAVSIDIKTSNIQENIRLIKSHKITCAFLALHGRFGEDGQIQKLLDGLNIPYTGSGAAASKLAMDKVASRVIFKDNGLNVPAYSVVDRSSYNTKWKKQNTKLKFPLVVKPAENGSSVGLSIIDKREGLDRAMDLAFGFDERIIIEDYISGRELTVGILDDKPLPLVEIIPKKRFFDYEAKYLSGMTDYVVPAKLKSGITAKVQEAGLSAHRLLGCSGSSRVDIILDKKNIPFVLEVNTIPGLTSTSLLPKAAKAAGIEFDRLCIKLIELAYEKTQP
jgi:D-alanine-D-alanine ligase